MTSVPMLKSLLGVLTVPFVLCKLSSEYVRCSRRPRRFEGGLDWDCRRSSHVTTVYGSKRSHPHFPHTKPLPVQSTVILYCQQQVCKIWPSAFPNPCLREISHHYNLIHQRKNSQIQDFSQTHKWGFLCERQSSEVLKAGKGCATPVSKTAKSKVLKLHRCSATYRQSGQVTLRDVGVNEALQFLLKVDVWCPCAAGPSRLAGHAWTKSWIQRLLWRHAWQVSGDRIMQEVNQPCYALQCDILHLLLSNQCFSQVFQTVW